MKRIEQFTHDDRDFVYLDLSGFKNNDDFIGFINESKPIISKYAENSLYTITNIEDIRFDSKTKEVVAEWTECNKPYVKRGAVIGINGIKKIMVNAIFAISGRKNMIFATTKEEAVKRLLEE